MGIESRADSVGSSPINSINNSLFQVVVSVTKDYLPTAEGARWVPGNDVDLPCRKGSSTRSRATSEAFHAMQKTLIWLPPPFHPTTAGERWSFFFTLKAPPTSGGGVRNRTTWLEIRTCHCGWWTLTQAEEPFQAPVKKTCLVEGRTSSHSFDVTCVSKGPGVQRLSLSSSSRGGGSIISC